MDEQIPKIIHQIWIQGNEQIPDKLKPNQKMIMDMHHIPNLSAISDLDTRSKDWRYILWDEIMILSLLNKTGKKDWIDTYYKFSYLHQKVDFAKMLILYTYGGVYIDMDSYTHQPLDSLFEKYSNYDFIVSKLKLNSLGFNIMTCGQTNYCINNGNYISKKGSDILVKMMDSIKSSCNFYETREMCIRQTTGPKIFDNFIKEYKDKENFPNKSKVIILPNDFMEPCVRDDCDITENTYIIHKHEASWFSGPCYLFNKYYSKAPNTWDIIILLFLVTICFFILRFILRFILGLFKKGK